MIKIKRKLHNKMFKYRQLKFYQYSIVSDLGDLECYYSKWFLILSFIPVLFVGTIAEGFPNTFKMLVMYFKEPYSYDSLTMSELKKIKKRYEITHYPSNKAGFSCNKFKISLY